MYVNGLNEGLRAFGEWVGRQAKDPGVRARYSVPHYFREFIALIDNADEDGSLRVRADYGRKNDIELAHLAYRLTGIFRPRVLFIDPAKPFECPDWMLQETYDSYRSYAFLPDIMRMLQERCPHDSGVLPTFAGQMVSAPDRHLTNKTHKALREQLDPLRKPLLETLPKLLNVRFARGTSLEGEKIFDGLVVDTFFRTLEYLAAGFIGDDKATIDLYGQALQDYLLCAVPIAVDREKAIFLKTRAR